MTTKEKILFAIGVMMILWGFPWIFIGAIMPFADPTTPGNEPPTIGQALAIALFLGIIPVVTGFFLCRRMKNNARTRDGEVMERTVMTLAKQHSGMLTASELAMDTPLSITQAQKVLEGYAEQGVVELMISDSGAKVYRFREFLSIEEKQRAEGI